VPTLEEQRLSSRADVTAPLYAYGIVRPGAPAPLTRGVLDAPVRVVEGGSVAALTSSLIQNRVRAKRRDLIAHSDVLQDAFGSGVVLPLRFGMLFDSEDELRSRFLDDRSEELLRLLDRFDGLAEMRLRVRYHDQESVLTAVVKDEPEIVRMRERSRTQADLVRLGELIATRYEQRRAVDAEAIVRRLGAHAAETQVDETDDELGVVKASFLMRDRDLKKFDAELDAVALRLRHLAQFTCTGPLPPHSFVSLGGGS
jgi:Gas vesicle synthesis protein GvpL/GvpF